MRGIKLSLLLIFIMFCLSALTYADVIKKVDTDGDGIPDTYVISGEIKPSSAQKPKTSTRININTATQTQLRSLPGIGPKKAQAIIDGRPYHSIKDLIKSKRIGHKIFNKIKNYITVGESTTPISQKPEPAGKININTASQTQLETLRRIGPVTAKAIIAGRPYTDTEAIIDISGVSPAIYKKIKKFITVGKSTTSEISSSFPVMSTSFSIEKIFPAFCTKVFDGDTIVVRDAGSSSRKVRLVGIDTPEVKHGRNRAQPGAYAAKGFTKSRCLHKTIYLSIDRKDPTDKYNRTLALIYLNREDAQKGEYYSLNAMLLRGGYAKILYIPPSEFNPYSWATKPERK